MGTQGLLLELLLTGFFAIACMRARAVPIGKKTLGFRDLFRFTGRIERLRRSRWQWCSIVVLLIVARVQWGIPLFVEITFALLLVLFLAVPEQKQFEEAPLGR
jgi:hypothetical protein